MRDLGDTGVTVSCRRLWGVFPLCLEGVASYEKIGGEPEPITRSGVKSPSGVPEQGHGQSPTEAETLQFLDGQLKQ